MLDRALILIFLNAIYMRQFIDPRNGRISENGFADFLFFLFFEVSGFLLYAVPALPTNIKWVAP